MVEGRISLPRTGAWTAELVLDSSAAMSGPVALALAGVTFKGTVKRSGPFRGALFVGMVGGKGGMSGEAKAKSYRAATVALPLRDIATGSGEALAGAIHSDILTYPLPHWVQAAGTWGSALEQLLVKVGGKNVWRVLPDGALWVGADTWETAKLKAEVIEQDVLRRRIFAGILPQLLPGVTWMGARVSYVEHRIAETLRSTVWFEDA